MVSEDTAACSAFDHYTLVSSFEKLRIPPWRKERRIDGL